MKTRLGIRLAEDMAHSVMPDREHKPSLVRCVFHWCWQTLLWFLAVSPGCLLIAYGASGVFEQRLVTVGRLARYEHVWQGSAAVGWGWMFVGVGFWTLGYFCHLRTGRAIFKYVGWALALVAGAIGVSVLLTRLVTPSS